MKKIIVLLAACLLQVTVRAQNDTSKTNSNENLSWKNKYCATIEDGNLTIRNQGVPLTSDITLENGTKITVDGAVLKNDGTRRTLNEGECVDKDGNIAPKTR